jgi:5-methylcytosine-specific restriction enzyme A
MTFSPISLVSRKVFSTKQRAKIFLEQNGICNICQGKIQVGQAFDIDHVIPLALGGTNDAENLRPVHERCHRGEGSKTSDDIKAIRRADRLAKKHHGMTKPKRKWPSRKFGS